MVEAEAATATGGQPQPKRNCDDDDFTAMDRVDIGYFCTSSLKRHRPLRFFKRVLDDVLKILITFSRQ